MVSTQDKIKYSQSFSNRIYKSQELLTEESYRRFFNCIDGICLTLLKNERNEINKFIKNLEKGEDKLDRYKKILVEIINILEKNDFLTYDTLIDYKSKGFREK